MMITVMTMFDSETSSSSAHTPAAAVSAETAGGAASAAAATPGIAEQDSQHDEWNISPARYFDLLLNEVHELSVPVKSHKLCL